ncbi:uncharacterized protein LOC116121170 [Pistacia vera]|uniref:uncharacterized protein LOC116121170 n=1 Tax=Pistacia vera TaxID=55513 RepID=UPI001262BDAC|nr:uncharacterized protein LOC116121170 [Pistacia vera]
MAGADPPQTYSEALRRAMRAEIFENKITLVGPSIEGSSEPPSAPQREKVEGGKSKEMKSNKKKFQPRQNRRDLKSKRPRTEGFPPCPKCGSNHSGECLRDQNVCYRCRQPRHLRRDCKAHLPLAVQSSRGTSARVFTMAQGEAKASPLAVIEKLGYGYKEK